MKFHLKFIAFIQLLSIVLLPINLSAAQDGFEIPKIISFTVSPIDIDISKPNNTLTFTLEVSHSVGIASSATNIVFKSNETNTQISSKLTRTDNPIDFKLKKVTFKGTLDIPDSLSPGAYNFYAEPITAMIEAGRVSPKTGNIVPENFRSFPDFESSVLVRSNGELGLNFQTFVGPSYTSTFNVADNKPRTLFTSEPIWKVGESYNVDDYFEKRTSLVDLKISSTTPTICLSDGKMLKFVSTGICVFVVYTPKTKDYVYKKLDLNVAISESRKIRSILVTQISDQTSSDLPKIISIPSAYDNAGNIVMPTTTTPGVCVPTINSVKIISGGTCTLKYYKEADPNFLASDIYTQSFEIKRDPQTISFTLPNAANVSSKSLTLAATASSGSAVAYSTTSTGICSITGSTLNLLKSGICSVTATQAGTSTMAPVSATVNITLTGMTVVTKKTITCIKGKTTKKVTGTNPKCPTGYKLKK